MNYIEKYIEWIKKTDSKVSENYLDYPLIWYFFVKMLYFPVWLFDL